MSDAPTAHSCFPILGSLDLLKRGGRIGGAQAFLGSLLSIKPVLEIRYDVVEASATGADALGSLATKVLHAVRLGAAGRGFGLSFDADELATLLSPVDCLHDPVVSEFGPVIGAYAGPE